MTKQPLQWHEECLKKAKRFAAEAEQKALQARDLADRMTKDIEIREQQIAEAKKRGLSGFDQERFLVKRSN